MTTINSKNQQTASSGKILQGQGIGTASAFSTATYPSTATSTNKILVANGTNWVASTPTFPNASATSRKIIVSDGTNWVASTETWAIPSSSGNVFTSDGTNWVSIGPGGGLLTVSGTLTNSQIKNLNGTPVAAVSAQGNGTLIVPMSVQVKFNYGGTNAFSATVQSINLYYGTSTSIAIVLSSSQIKATATSYDELGLSPSVITSTTPGNSENKALNFYNALGPEISGNAANNNTITYSITYYVISI